MKFEVGDKVKYVSEISIHNKYFKIGDILEIVEIDGYALKPYKCMDKEKNHINLFVEDELELVTINGNNLEGHIKFNNELIETEIKNENTKSTIKQTPASICITVKDIKIEIKEVN